MALPHPDATAALVAGGTELTGHFSNPPFQDQALANPKVHVVLDSYELLGPNSPTVLFATEKFRQDNPKTYRAFVEGAEGSGGLRPERQGGRRRYLYPGDRGEDRPSRAAEDHRQSAGGVQRHAEEHLSAGGVSYRVGAIRNKPASWQDYFFQDGAPLQGS